MASSEADGARTPLLCSTPRPSERSPSQVPRVEDGSERLDADVPPPPTEELSVSMAVRRRLYVSHFLSAWNSRVFEFGAVLYLASIYPGTLLPMSVYALSRQASAIVLSPAIGRYIDNGNRLKVVRLSIVLQRLAVATSCVLFWFLSTGWGWIRALQSGSLAILAVLACVEKLCAVMNLVAVERDWVIVIAQENEASLRVLNAQMRRIDLICKLAGPFFISMLDGVSTEMAILANLGMNLASILVEYFAIARVYTAVPALQQPKTSATSVEPLPPAPSRRRRHCAIFKTLTNSILGGATQDLRAYFHHRAVLPSFAGALLYFTVLSFSGQMVTYLLSSGFGSVHVAAARTVSVGFELSATWMAPRVMARIGPVRTGIWFVSWQCLCLAAGASAFWGLRASDAGDAQLLAAAALVGGAILSRVGLWGYDLSAQVIIQEEVEAERRGAFSSVEASWQSVFELCSYVSTIVFSRPEQFQWPVLLSCMAVFSAGGLYASFVRRRRGHLLHFSKCIEHRSGKTRHGGPESYERLAQSPNV
ncbi:iron-regulated transporter [Diplodia corticola]|uniref:Solute carrier family 40 member n=1 Tax=Diplodia corticola TaxID=236234 RepID=A0A1J9QKX3_9PEZI|nr:iron-regulated transporter [Diplodia corticola]OJD29534.1 iron-regulated transporter [Diplodia corticola]